MSPIRKSDDFRTTEINSWDEFIQEQLLEDMAEVDYTDLPDRGKPIKIWRTDVDPDKDLAFSRLKNAGVKPTWMELDQEIGQLTEQLWTLLERVEQQLRTDIERMNTASTDAEPPVTWRERWRGWFRQDYREESSSSPTVTSIAAYRERERRRFLEHAALLDKRIVEFHDSLPQGAQHLQRLRWLPARAERVFDDRIDLNGLWNTCDVQPETGDA
ncbi:MAG: DUF1992 domain-containing protein [Thermomicrobiales bacterium]|nr:DUF1992 domain-containing protein [Thermomicrobiales bacterium]